MGLKKSQLFRVSDLAAVRNQNIPVKVWVYYESDIKIVARSEGL
jgi:hypothetical protein